MLSMVIGKTWKGKRMSKGTDKKTEALKLALAEQPAQQPVSVTDELVNAYCEAWKQSFLADNAYHTVSVSPQDRKHIEAGLKAALAEQPASKPWVGLTDEQITAGARALCKQMAEACGVDVRDQWQLYSDTFKEDAKAVLEAAHGIKGDA